MQRWLCFSSLESFQPRSGKARPSTVRHSVNPGKITGQRALTPPCKDREAVCMDVLVPGLDCEEIVGRSCCIGCRQIATLSQELPPLQPMRPRARGSLSMMKPAGSQYYMVDKR